jgi:predicted RND superfamily exporter protein
MESRTNAIHRSVEDRFERWGQLVARRAGWIIVAVVLVTLGLGSQLGRLTIDASTEGFLRPDNPARQAYDEFRERFGRDQVTVLSVEPPEIFDIAFLTKLRDFHDALEEEVPMLEDINSLANARSTYGEEDVLNVDDLLEEIPQTPDELATFRKRVMQSPSYRNLVISEDGTITSIVIESDAYSQIGMTKGDDLAGFGEDFGAELVEEGDGSAAGQADRPYITSAEEMAIVAKIREIAARFEGPEFRIDIGGNQVFPLEVQAAMGREMPRFLAASLLVIAALLYILFRRISAVVLPLLVVILAIVATLSLMAIFGIAVKITTQVLPTFLLAVGIGYTVHLLNGFYMRLDTGSDPTHALIGALRHTGLPIVMTGVTTMVGVLSFTTAEMAPVGDFGWVTAAGVMLTLFYSLALLPALLVALPPRPKAPRRMLEGAAASEGEIRPSFVLAFCARVSARHPWPLAIGTTILLLIALILIPQIKFSADPLLMLPYEHPTRVTQRMLDARMGGGVSFEVLVETGRENGMKDPALLQRMAKIEERIAEYDAEGERVGRTMSVLDVVRETHQALNENRSAYYTIPDDPRLLAQELLLFENSGSDDLERLVDSLFTQARMTVRADFLEPMDRVGLLDRAEREFQEIMGDLASVRITGIVDVMTYTATATVRSVVSSYTLAFAMITPLMMLLIGSLRAGLISMVPNLVPILLTLGLMVVLDISLDVFTLLVGCIAVGLAVDDTIHLIHGFRRELASGKDPETAIRDTLETTGRALLFTTVILCSGFVVFWLSSMDGLQKFGFLISFAVSTALVLDILVTPALLLLVTGRPAKASDDVTGGSAATSATPASPVDPEP